MDIKAILGLTSLVFGAGIVAQDPSFEYPGIRPVLISDQDEQTPRTGGFKSADPVLQSVVTVRFKNASPSEVFDWLSNKGVSFVTETMSNDVKVTLNLNEVPLETAVNALGDALGGSWSRRGTVFIFRSNAPRIAPAEAAIGWMTSPSDFDDEEFNADMAKKMADFQRQIDKRFGPGSDFERTIQKQYGPNGEFTKRMQEMERNFQRQYGPSSDFARQMEKLRVQSANVPDRQMLESLTRLNQADAAKTAKISADVHKELTLRLSGQGSCCASAGSKPATRATAPRGQVANPPAPPRAPNVSVNFGAQDFKGILKSLTPAQREKNRKQGFLYWSDLTAAQKKMMGAQPGQGTWTVSYNHDGESFTVKSDVKR